MKLGIGVYASSADERYDLVFDLATRLVRVQCKWASVRRGVIVVPLYSARRTAHGLRRSLYSSAEIDAFAAYSPDTERCYFAEIRDVHGLHELSLRFRPTRNNQARGVRWASDYEFAVTLGLALGP